MPTKLELRPPSRAKQIFGISKKLFTSESFADWKKAVFAQLPLDLDSRELLIKTKQNLDMELRRRAKKRLLFLNKLRPENDVSELSWASGFHPSPHNPRCALGVQRLETAKRYAREDMVLPQVVSGRAALRMPLCISFRLLALMERTVGTTDQGIRNEVFEFVRPNGLLSIWLKQHFGEEPAWLPSPLGNRSWPSQFKSSLLRGLMGQRFGNSRRANDPESVEFKESAILWALFNFDPIDQFGTRGCFIGIEPKSLQPFAMHVDGHWPGDVDLKMLRFGPTIQKIRH